MDLKLFEEEDNEICAALLEGDEYLGGFLSMLLESYGGRVDWREFSESERDEIILNAFRTLELLREA